MLDAVRTLYRFILPRWYGDQNNGGFWPPPTSLLLVVNTSFCRISRRSRVTSLFCILGERCRVSLTTKITTDSESPTSVSYKWSIVTVSISYRFRVIRNFIYDRISYLGPPNCFFLPLTSTKWSSINKTRKIHFLVWERAFWNSAVWLAVRPARVEKKVG